MALPRGVQEQADKANAIQAQLSGQPVEPVVTDSVPTPGDKGEQDWEKRYKGMQKSHAKAVGELRDDNERLTADNEEIKLLLDKAQSSEPAVQVPTFTEAEVKEYGQDFLDMVVRVASTINAGRSQDDIAQELAELKDQFGAISQVQKRSAEDRFYDELEAAVPKWEQINELDAFKAWLKETMPLTSSERQRFLDAAHKRFDAKTVISFFTTWLGESGMQSYMPDTVSAPSGMPEVEGGKETFIVTQAEIGNFYDELKMGKWKGREEEARQNELKINRAIKEHRVR
jgi:hypothetical protein